jgi:hypothetical protein
MNSSSTVTLDRQAGASPGLVAFNKAGTASYGKHIAKMYRAKHTRHLLRGVQHAWRNHICHCPTGLATHETSLSATESSFPTPRPQNERIFQRELLTHGSATIADSCTILGVDSLDLPYKAPKKYIHWCLLLPLQHAVQQKGCGILPRYMLTCRCSPVQPAYLKQ